MSGLVALRRQRATAQELHAVVRTMKAMAASSISQYQQAAAALDVYHATVRLALAACLRQQGPLAAPPARRRAPPPAVEAIVFGSDLGMVGQFNQAMCAFVQATLAALPGPKRLWPVGARMAARLAGGPWTVEAGHALPLSPAAAAPLLAGLLSALADRQPAAADTLVLVFHHRQGPSGGAAPDCTRLLPLDRHWRDDLLAQPWPTARPPQVLGALPATLAACVHEYLFVSLFRACIQSQASEQACRLTAMQRAEKNIDGLLGQLQRRYHSLRQGAIDEELFELLAGYSSLDGR